MQSQLGGYISKLSLGQSSSCWLLFPITLYVPSRVWCPKVMQLRPLKEFRNSTGLEQTAIVEPTNPINLSVISKQFW